MNPVNSLVPADLRDVKFYENFMFHELSTPAAQPIPA
jgi:hypothetical protein